MHDVDLTETRLSAARSPCRIGEDRIQAKKRLRYNCIVVVWPKKYAIFICFSWKMLSFMVSPPRSPPSSHPSDAKASELNAKALQSRAASPPLRTSIFAEFCIFFSRMVTCHFSQRATGRQPYREVQALGRCALTPLSAEDHAARARPSPWARSTPPHHLRTWRARICRAVRPPSLHMSLVTRTQRDTAPPTGGIFFLVPPGCAPLAMRASPFPAPTPDACIHWLDPCALAANPPSR
jgi:hypothetical protein